MEQVFKAPNPWDSKILKTWCSQRDKTEHFFSFMKFSKIRETAEKTKRRVHPIAGPR